MFHRRWSNSTALSTGALLLALVATACLTLRNGGVIAFVFNDEYSYSMYARLAPMANAIVPDYLYFLVYGTSKECAGGFMECVRGLNVVFFIGSAPFIYMTCRRVASAFASSWVALLVVIGPLNSYTVYFMPEAMYFFGFWVMAWLALELQERAGYRQWMLLGFVVGLMSLVKPHGLFLLPALCAFALYLNVRKTWRDLGRAAALCALLLVSALTTKLLIGYLIVGRAGLTLFGHFYSGMAGASAKNMDHFVALGGYSLVSLKSHVLAILLALGLSLGAVAGMTVSGPWRVVSRPAIHRLAVFTTLMLGSLVVLVSLFTGSLAISDVSELARLHQRYYDFALPLCMICSAAMASSSPDSVSIRWRILFASALLIGLGIIFAQRFQGLRPGVLDGPWFDGLMAHHRGFRFVAYAMTLCVMMWPVAPRIAAKAFLYVALPLSVASAGVMVNRELAQHRDPTVYERAGWAARELVPAPELASLVVVCSEPAEGFRVLFNVDAADASFQIQPDDSAYRWSALPAGKTWILSVGGRAMPQDAIIVERGQGYILARSPMR